VSSFLEQRLEGEGPYLWLDAPGLLFGVLVHAASTQDADSAGDLLRRI
jgi:putative transposase